MKMSKIERDNLAGSIIYDMSSLGWQVKKYLSFITAKLPAVTIER